jgi:hypothetical protein
VSLLDLHRDISCYSQAIVARGYPCLIVAELTRLRQELHLLAGEGGCVDPKLHGVTGVATSEFPPAARLQSPGVFLRAGVPETFFSYQPGADKSRVVYFATHKKKANMAHREGGIPPFYQRELNEV